VFVSSHLLSEIEQTCDRVAILSRGRCVTHGTVAEVSTAAGHGAAMLVTVDDLPGALAVLGRAGIPAELVDGRVRVAVAATDAARVSRTLGEQGYWIRELRAEERSLEDLFLEVTDEIGADATGDSERPQLEEVGS
jgi:ABC-2 type transport system ATP-binding protein